MYQTNIIPKLTLFINLMHYSFHFVGGLLVRVDLNQALWEEDAAN